MGRGKTPMGLIGDRRKRAAALASRKKGLMKMASELSTLCNVPVAVVLGGPVDGGAPHHHRRTPEVWESEHGVFDRYRALPAEKRAEHTHLRHLEGNLGKEHAKLARVLLRGPAALAQPADADLNGMGLDELRELLESLDAALLATAERKKALGLPEHDDYYAVDVGGAPCSTGGGGHYEYEMLEPDDGRRLDHQAAMWEDANAMNYMMQPGYYGIPNMNLTQPACDARGYMLDMAPVIPHPAYGYGGFQYTDGYDAGMGSSQMQVPSNVDDNLAMWHAAEPCNAVVPAGWHPDLFADNSLYTAPGCLGMGDCGDAMNYLDCNDFQWSGTSTSQNSSNIDYLHYLRLCLE